MAYFDHRKMLMTSTKNPNAPRNDGTTPIFMAAQYNRIEVVKLLMDTTQNPNAPMNNGATPLYIAAKNNFIEVVQLLEGGIAKRRRITSMDRGHVSILNLGGRKIFFT